MVGSQQVRMSLGLLVLTESAAGRRILCILPGQGASPNFYHISFTYCCKLLSSDHAMGCAYMTHYMCISTLV